MSMRLVAAVMASLVLAAPAHPAACRDDKELRRLKVEVWPALYLKQDYAGLRDFLHEDFRGVDAEGHVTTRADEVEWLRKNSWSADDFRFDILSIECAGNTAIIIGMGSSVEKRNADGSAVRSAYASTNVFVRTSDGWHPIASHVSPSVSQVR